MNVKGGGGLYFMSLLTDEFPTIAQKNSNILWKSLLLLAVDSNIYVVEDMKPPKEDYEIRKSVVSDPGTGEDLFNFL